MFDSFPFIIFFQILSMKLQVLLFFCAILMLDWNQVAQKLLLQPKTVSGIFSGTMEALIISILVNRRFGTRTWSTISPTPGTCMGSRAIHGNGTIRRINNRDSPRISLPHTKPSIRKAARNVFLQASLWLSLVFSPTAAPLFCPGSSPITKGARQALQSNCLKMNNTESASEEHIL